METVDPEIARREAIGAFIHEIRTPLTSIRMVLEIGRRASSGAGVTLDDELVEMMETSVSDMQHLADALQDTSRLERGRVALKGTRGPLSEVLERVRGAVASDFRLEAETGPELTSEWDGDRLATALRGMAEAANRCGSGDGVVRASVEREGAGCVVLFESGVPGGEAKPINADLGYEFYRGYALVRAMDGEVGVQREQRYLAVRVWLPA